jgi:hypothetical protein
MSTDQAIANACNDEQRWPPDRVSSVSGESIDLQALHPGFELQLSLSTNFAIHTICPNCRRLQYLAAVHLTAALRWHSAGTASACFFQPCALWR